jgi:predicted membrane-bound dolichyl-phosphate-mannose-protein mannosyltransferase
MRVSRQLYIAWGPDVPDSIRTLMLLNSLNVEFEQEYLPLSEKTESTYDDLYIWCVSNCTTVFSCKKILGNEAIFMFYAAEDMRQFQQRLIMENS